MMKKLLSTILTICMITVMSVCSVYADSGFSKFFDFDDFPDTLSHGETYNEWTGIYSNVSNYPGTTIVSEPRDDGKCVKFTVRNRVELGLRYLGVNLTEIFEVDFSFNRADTNHYWMLSLDGGWSIPVIRFEAGGNTNSKINIFGEILPEVFETNTWYDVKCLVNLKTKLVSVKVFKEDSLVAQKEVTYSALPEIVENLKFGSHPFGGGSWGQAIPNGSSSISFDDISIKQIYPLSLDSYSFEDDPDNVKIGDEIDLEFNNEIKDSSLTLNGTEVELDNKGDNLYKITSNLLWNTSYEIKGTVTDIYDRNLEIDLKFKTILQPESFVNYAGFYSNDEKIYELTPGEIKAKFVFWQTEDTHYTYSIALFKVEDGVIEMLDLKANSLQSGQSLSEERELSVQVPDDCENCYIKTFVWNSLDEGVAQSDENSNGNNVLMGR